MGGLSSAKADAVAAFVRSLPEETLRTLRLGLTPMALDGGMEPLRRAVEAELSDRRLRDAVLAELCVAATPAATRPLVLPAVVVAVVWDALRDHDPAALRRADALLAARETPDFEAVSLERVAAAAHGLAFGEGAFAAARSRLDSWPGAADGVIHVLRLAPIVRACAPRARTWLRQGGLEEASSLRLAMRDASAVCSDGGPILVDLLASMFSDPTAGLRLVCAVMDRPTEAFLAGSELAPFALNVLDAAEGAVEALRRASRLCDRAEGAAMAASIASALDSLEELEHAVQLDRERPWGRRVAALRRALALAAEARLKEADGRVAAALPVRSGRPGLKQVRGAPCFADPLDPAAVSRAEASLAFIEGVRRAASKGGFGSLRAKVIEALDSRIETYVEDLLEHLHAEGPTAGEDVQARLQVAADLLGLVRDPSAAQIVRRRMAAA